MEDRTTTLPFLSSADGNTCPFGGSVRRETAVWGHYGWLTMHHLLVFTRIWVRRGRKKKKVVGQTHLNKESSFRLGASYLYSWMREHCRAWWRCWWSVGIGTTTTHAVKLPPWINSLACICRCKDFNCQPTFTLSFAVHKRYCTAGIWMPVYPTKQLSSGNANSEHAGFPQEIEAVSKSQRTEKEYKDQKNRSAARWNLIRMPYLIIPCYISVWLSNPSSLIHAKPNVIRESSFSTYFTTSSTGSWPEIPGWLNIGRPTQDLPASFHDRYIYYVMMAKTGTTGLPNRLTRYLRRHSYVGPTNSSWHTLRLPFVPSSTCSCVSYPFFEVWSRDVLVPTMPTPRL